MKHARRRLGAIIAVAVAAIAIGYFLVGAPARDRDAADLAEPAVSAAGATPGHSAAGMQSTADMASSDPSGARPHGADVVIPEKLPSVDPVDPPEYATGLPEQTLYASNPEARAHFADKLPFGVDDRSYVEFNRRALTALEVGSTLTLRTPDDGKAHTIRINEVVVHPNGDKSWLGRVLNAGGEVLPAVFTQGVDSSFGSFSTQGGTYSLEAEGRLGWIANINGLRQHQDFDTSDVMVPDPRDAKRPPGQK